MKSQNRKSYSEILTELETAISEGNVDIFKKLCDVVADSRTTGENQVTLKNDYDAATNPIRNTNLVILACKHNKVKILEYLFNSGILNNLSIAVKITNLLPADEDESRHNAFYYAIRSGNTELLDLLIKNWPDNYFATRLEELDEILSRAYEELQLKRVLLSEKMEIFVEKELINLRFFVEASVTQDHSFGSEFNNTKKRIEFFLRNIGFLKTEYSSKKEVDEQFLFVAKSIAQNIHIVKRQLKSTYDRLPWEEMEFCLVAFISSHTKREEINVFFRATMNKSKILNHLEHFAKKLQDEMDIIKGMDIGKLVKLPRLQREKVVANTISSYPQFEELYKDYRQMRDICSLEKINGYIKLALSTDPKEREGQLIITRALQIIGEHLKNTLESPKLSNTTSELLLLSLQMNARKIIMDLRDSLSHYDSLSKRIEIEENGNINFFVNVQNDIKKVGDVIGDILYDNKMKTIRELLTKIIDSENLDEIKEVAEVLDNAGLEKITSVNFKMLEHEKIRKIVKELSLKITDQTQYETEMFDEINSIINCEGEGISSEIVTDYVTGFGTLKALCQDININKISSNVIRGMKFRSNLILGKIPPKVEPHSLKKIADLSRKIFDSVQLRMQDDKLDMIKSLMYNILYITEFGTGDIKWIEELREQLNKKEGKICMPKQSSETLEKHNNQLALKLSELKSILNNKSFGGSSIEKISSYRKDKKLQSLVEMLVLDIMSILGSSKQYLENNQLFLDDSTPLLIGICLRNYLAHCNGLVDVLFSDPSIAVILNAKMLAEEDLMGSKKKIGKFVPDDPFKLRINYDRGMATIINQEKMFVALEEANLEGLKDCLKRGGDIHGRSINSLTTLHFAAKGPSLEVVKFILDQNVSVDIKDVDGQNPLHTAAAHGRANIVEFFVKETQLSVDDLNNTGKTPLHIAAQNGHSNTVEVLLRNKANTQDMRGFSPVHYAIKNNHIDVAKILLKHDVNVDINQAVGGFTPLHGAAESGHLEIVNFLLENNANVNAGDDRNWKPLHAAAYNGYLEIVKALIRKGADVNARVVNGCSPLYYAVENDDEKIVNILLKHGANVDAVNKTHNVTPLHQAAKNGQERIVKILLKNKANANVAAFDGSTPLHLAALNCNLEIIAVLLEHGADIHARSINGVTPLHIAADSGHKIVVENFIQHKADINAKGINNGTPLHIAAHKGHKDVVDLLIKNKARLDAKDIKGCTPSHAAAINGSKDIIDIILQNKADINIKNSAGMTPLHIAVLKGHRDAIVYLVRNNAEVNSRADRNLTPLHAAVLGGHKDVVRLLIEYEAQIDARDIEGGTPLHLAVEAGQKEIVKILVRNGANVNGNCNNMTILLSAIKGNQKEIVEVLIANGANVNVNDGQALVMAVYSGYTNIVEILLKSEAKECINSKNCLHVAATQGHKKIVMALIKEGANVDAKDIYNETPLFYASREGYEEIVDILIAAGSNVNVKSSEGYTALQMAAAQGHVNVVKVLLDNSVRINAKDDQNRTPLEMAVSYGHLEVVKLLLPHKEEGIDDDWTILHIASQGSNLEMVKYLVDSGCDVNARNAFGSKPIHIAAREGYKDIVEFFLSKGLSVKDRGAADQTLLHYAALKGHLEIINYLISQGSDINAKDANGSTPIHMAATFHHKEVLQVLLKNGAFYNVVDNCNRRPLQVAKNKNVIDQLELTEKLFEAVRRNSFSDVQNYIQAGAVVNVKNVDGETPLHYAAWKGYEEVVNTLLKNKADPNVVRNKGWTPLHYAAKFSHFKIVKALLSNNAIYNALSDGGKTPLDFTTNRDISNLFQVLNKSFQNVRNNNSQVVHDLNKIKDADTVKAIMGARNRENKTLIAAAILSNFSKIEQLKEVSQGDVYAQIHLASVLFNEGDYQPALYNFKEVFEKRKELLGSDNPATLDIQSYIAQVLYSQGSYQESLSTYEDIFKKQKKMLGLDGKTTLITRGNIALVLHRLGRNEEALNIYQEVYQKQSGILGPHHSDTIDTYFHMALVLERLGRYEKALHINRAVYEIRKKTLGANDPSGVRAQNNIAMVLASQGNYEEALKIYREVLEKKKVVLGINHADTMRTLHNIAGLLFNQHKFFEALAAHEEILNIQRNVLGPNHPDTLMSQYNMGTVLFAQGRLIGALKAYRKCFDQMKAALGPTHPSVLDILSKLKSLNLRFNIQGCGISEILQNLQKEINIAASNGDVLTIQRLLQDEADVNDQDIDGRAPLHYAVSYGHIDVVKILLNNGADVTQTTNKGNTPLHTATSKGYKEIVQVLLQHVSSDKLNDLLNAKTTATGATALYVACSNGCLSITKMLLKRGAIYNITNKDRKTPFDVSKEQNISNLLKLLEELFEGAKSGNAKILDKLKEIKPDEFVALTNSRNSQGNTLLQVAGINRHINVVRQLSEMLKYGNQNFQNTI